MAVLSRTIQLSNFYNVKVSTFDHMYPATYIMQRVHAITHNVFRLFPFRSPLLRESRCFLLLALLRCFSSRRSPSYPMCSDMSFLVFPRKVSPFGHPRDHSFIDNSPAAYGSLTPPSSPLDAKASTKSPFQLITNFINL